MTFLYFAYGSNMLGARLRARCPSAALVGLALARGYEVQFSKRSRDGSGKATLVEAHGGEARGVLYEISREELGRLDAVEGKDYARRDDFEVVRTDGGGPVAAKTYVAIRTEPGLRPYDWYLALVAAGAVENRLGSEYVSRLRTTEYAVDQEEGRPARRGAVRALEGAGFRDYRKVLTGCG